MVGFSGGPGGAGPLFYVAHALAPTSTFSLAHWGEIMEAAVDSLATGTRGGFYYFLAGSVVSYRKSDEARGIAADDNTSPPILPQNNNDNPACASCQTVHYYPHYLPQCARVEVDVSASACAT